MKENEKPADEAKVIELRMYGFDEELADELRAALETFAEDWDSPEMDAYDDYDAVRSHSSGKATE